MCSSTKFRLLLQCGCHRVFGLFSVSSPPVFMLFPYLVMFLFVTLLVFLVFHLIIYSLHLSLIIASPSYSACCVPLFARSSLVSPKLCPALCFLQSDVCFCVSESVCYSTHCLLLTQTTHLSFCLAVIHVSSFCLPFFSVYFLTLSSLLSLRFTSSTLGSGPLSPSSSARVSIKLFIMYTSCLVLKSLHTHSNLLLFYCQKCLKTSQ